MMHKINGIMLKEDFVKILELVKTCGSVTSRKRFQFLVYILQQKGLGFKERFKYHPYPSSNLHETRVGENHKEE